MSEHVLHPDQFHASLSNTLQPGDVIRPTEQGWADTPRAYATDWKEEAADHAAYRSFEGPRGGGQGQLFGSVYKVRPNTPGIQPGGEGTRAYHHTADPKGLTVLGHEGFYSHFAVTNDTDPSSMARKL
jgi:hypothetical protein